MAAISADILFTLAALLSTSFILGEICERIGLESIIGYITAGLLLGPAVLDVINSSSVTGFGTIGATLILFQAGLREENVKDIFTHRKGLDLGIGLLLGTFTVFLVFLLTVGQNFIPFDTAKQLIFIALAYSVVDIGVPSKIMLSRGLLRKETGKYAIKSAVINVAAGLAVLTALVLTTSSSLSELAIQIAGIAGFTAVFYLLHEFIDRLDDYIIMFEETEAEFAITFALLLFMAYTSEIIGLSSIIGAFFAGVIVSRSDFSSTHAFQEKIRAIGEGLFIPLFFASFGLGLTLFGHHGIVPNLDLAFTFFGLSAASKLGIGYLITKYHGRDNPLEIASTMLALDIESIVILLIGVDMGVFDSHLILEVFAPSVILGTLTITALYRVNDYLN